MKPIKSLLDLFTGKRTIIKNNLGGSGSYLLDKVGKISSRPGRTFFHQSIICCMADAFEYFLEIDTTNNVFYQNILSMTTNASEKFIKWETMYHTLMFTKGLPDIEYVAELEDQLHYIFEATNDDKVRYNDFRELLMKSEGEFAIKFSNAAASDIFNISEINSLDTSFIYNFYESCYTEFYRVFTKYTVANKNNLKDKDDVCQEALQANN